MISITTSRQDLETIQNYFVPYIEPLQQTRLNNVAYANVQSDEYLTCLAMNCVIDEVIAAIEKKYNKVSTGSQKIKLTGAQAIVLFRLLILLPLPPGEIYFQKLRTELITQLDEQLIAQALYQQAVHSPSPKGEGRGEASEKDYLDYEE